MPFDGNGNFNLSFDWNNDAANGIPITASRVQNEDQNIADGLSLCITKDGQSTATAIIPFAAGLSTNAGIQFPATEVSSVNPNNLDDYEEVTWVPTDSSGAGLTFSPSSALSIKVGRLVTIGLIMTFPSAASGNVSIAGLPYAVTTGAFAIGSINTTQGTPMIARLDGNTGVINLLDYTNTNITNSQMSGKLLIFTITYFAAA